MKRHLHLLLVAIIFTACQSIEEKRMESIRSYLAFEENIKGEIELKKHNQDDVLLQFFSDSALAVKSMNFLKDWDYALRALSIFTQSLKTDSSKRVWVKTMTQSQLDAMSKANEACG